MIVFFSEHGTSIQCEQNVNHIFMILKHTLGEYQKIQRKKKISMKIDTVLFNFNLSSDVEIWFWKKRQFIEKNFTQKLFFETKE